MWNPFKKKKEYEQVTPAQVRQMREGSYSQQQNNTENTITPEQVRQMRENTYQQQVQPTQPAEPIKAQPVDRINHDRTFGEKASDVYKSYGAVGTRGLASMARGLEVSGKRLQQDDYYGNTINYNENKSGFSKTIDKMSPLYSKSRDIGLKGSRALENTAVGNITKPIRKKVGEGIESVSKYAREGLEFGAEATEERLPQNYMQEYGSIRDENGKVDLSKLKNPEVVANIASQGFASMIPTLSMGALNPALGLGTAFLMEKGDATDSYLQAIAKDKGIKIEDLTDEDITKADINSTGYAIVSAGLEYAFPASQLKKLGGKRAVNAINKRIWTRMPTDIALSVMEEGGTEGVQRLTQNVIGNLEISDNVKLTDGVIDEAIAGAIAGGGMSSVTSIKAPQQIQETEETPEKPKEISEEGSKILDEINKMEAEQPETYTDENGKTITLIDMEKDQNKEIQEKIQEMPTEDIDLTVEKLEKLKETAQPEQQIEMQKYIDNFREAGRQKKLKVADEVKLLVEGEKEVADIIELPPATAKEVIKKTKEVAESESQWAEKAQDVVEKVQEKVQEQKVIKEKKTELLEERYKNKEDTEKKKEIQAKIDELDEARDDTFEGLEGLFDEPDRIEIAKQEKEAKKQKELESVHEDIKPIIENSVTNDEVGNNLEKLYKEKFEKYAPDEDYFGDEFADMHHAINERNYKEANDIYEKVLADVENLKKTEIANKKANEKQTKQEALDFSKPAEEKSKYNVGDTVTFDGEKAEVTSVLKKGKENKYRLKREGKEDIWTNELKLDSDKKQAKPKESKQKVTEKPNKNLTGNQTKEETKRKLAGLRQKENVVVTEEATNKVREDIIKQEKILKEIEEKEKQEKEARTVGEGDAKYDPQDHASGMIGVDNDNNEYLIIKTVKEQPSGDIFLVKDKQGNSLILNGKNPYHAIDNTGIAIKRDHDQNGKTIEEAINDFTKTKEEQKLEKPKQTKKKAVKSTLDNKDVGEKIGGARKDLVRKTTEEVNKNYTNKEYSEMTRAEAVPKIDYAKMKEAGISEDLLAIYAIYSANVPQKPRGRKARYYMDDWVKNVKWFRRVASSVMKNDTRILDALKFGKKDEAETNIETSIRLLKDLDFINNPKARQYNVVKQIRNVRTKEAKEDISSLEGMTDEEIVDLHNEKFGDAGIITKKNGNYYLGGVNLSRMGNLKDVIGGRIKTLNRKYEEKELYLLQKNGKNAQASGFYGGVFAETYDEILDLAKKIINVSGKKKNIDIRENIHIFQYRRNKKYVVMFKRGQKKIKLEEFDDMESAEKAMADEKKMQKWVKEVEEASNFNDQTFRGTDIREEHKDYRGGRDISSEEFMDTFGFRGVEFGNWVNKEERQERLNMAYDSFKELAELLGVPDKAMGLNNELGFAFGSRGKKGALAHYEPKKVVINLTKKKGAGTIAHEWFHAMDNYLRRLQGKGKEFLTTNLRYDEHKELSEAMFKLILEIQHSEMMKRSRLADEHKGKKYYTKHEELGARVFEQYIKDKLKEQGRYNDFLVTVNELQADLPIYPYLRESEKKKIYEKMDNFVKELKTEETDTGVRMYNKAETEDTLESQAKKYKTKEEGRLSEKYKEANNKRIQKIVNKMKKKLPKEIRDVLLIQIVDELNGGKTNADYTDGWIRMAKTMPKEQIEKIFIHEVRHLANDIFFNRKGGHEALLKWYDNLSSDEKAEIFGNKETYISYYDSYAGDKNRMAEETFNWAMDSEYIEKLDKNAWLRKARRTINEIIRDIQNVALGILKKEKIEGYKNKDFKRLRKKFDDALSGKVKLTPTEQTRYSELRTLHKGVNKLEIKEEQKDRARRWVYIKWLKQDKYKQLVLAREEALERNDIEEVQRLDDEMSEVIDEMVEINERLLEMEYMKDIVEKTMSGDTMSGDMTENRMANIDLESVEKSNKEIASRIVKLRKRLNKLKKVKKEKINEFGESEKGMSFIMGEDIKIVDEELVKAIKNTPYYKKEQSISDEFAGMYMATKGNRSLLIKDEDRLKYEGMGYKVANYNVSDSIREFEMSEGNGSITEDTEYYEDDATEIMERYLEDSGDINKKIIDKIASKDDEFNNAIGEISDIESELRQLVPISDAYKVGQEVMRIIKKVGQEKAIKQIKEKAEKSKKRAIERLKKSKEKRYKKMKDAKDKKIEDIRKNRDEKLESEKQKRREKVEEEKQKARDIQEAKNIIVAYAKEHLKAFPEQKKRLLVKVRDAKNQKDIDNAIAFIDRLFTQAQIKHTKAEIKKELKKTAPRKNGKKEQGKYTPEIHTILEIMKRVVSLSKNDAYELVAKNLDTGNGVLNDYQRMENYIVSIYHENQTAEKLSGFLNTIVDIKEKGKVENQLKNIARIEENAKRNKKTINVITGGEGIKPTDTTELKPTKWEKAKKKAKTSFESMFGWDDILDILSYHDKSSAKNESYLSQVFDMLPFKNAHKAGLRISREKLNTIFKEAYGVDDKGMRKLRKENLKEINIGTFKNSKGDTVELIMSKDEIMKRYAELLDPTLEPTFENMGYTDEMKNTIKNNLTKNDIKFVKANMKFLQDYYHRVAPVYEEMYGVRLPFNEFYTPIRRRGIEYDGMSNVSAFLGEQSTRSSIFKGSLNKRINSRKPLKDVGMFSSMEQHIAEMEHFIAFAEITRELNATFNNDEVREAIRQNFDESLLKYIDLHVNNIIRGGADNANRIAVLDWTRHAIVKMTLAIKPSILFKQISSFVAFMDAIPVTEFAKGTALFWKNPIRNSKMLMRNSELMRNRGEYMEQDYKEVAKSRVWDILTYNVKLGDRLGILFGGYAVYNYALNGGKVSGAVRKSNMTNEEYAIYAFEKITEQTQQSADITERSAWQTGGSLSRFFTTYQTSQNQYFRKEWGAWRNLFAGRGKKSQNIKTIAVFHFVVPTVFQFIASGFDWDEDEMKRAWILGSFNGIFILNDMFEMAVRSATGEKEFSSEVILYDIGHKIADMNRYIVSADKTDKQWEKFVRGSMVVAGFASGGVPIKTGYDMMSGIIDADALRAFGYSKYTSEARSPEGKAKKYKRKAKKAKKAGNYDKYEDYKNKYYEEAKKLNK